MNCGKVEEPSSSRSQYPSTARFAATSAILTVTLSRSDRAPSSSTVSARPGWDSDLITDGTPRTLQVGNQALVFRHASPRNMATAGCTSGTVIQALRDLGKQNVDEEVISRLRKSLTSNEKAMLKKDRLYARGWMQPLFDRILETGTG